MDRIRNVHNCSTTLEELPGYVKRGRNMSADNKIRTKVSMDFQRKRDQFYMNIESNRVASFTAPLWHHNFPISIYRLANAGLYSTGNGDEVECFSCSVTIANWQKGDSAKGRHKKMYPNCRFVNGSDMRNIADVQYVPTEKSSQDFLPSPVHPSNSQYRHLVEERNSLNKSENFQSHVTSLYSFRFEKKRLETFNLWPLSNPVDPYEMAQSGFFMLNISTVQCFACFCKLSTSSWKIGDRPIKKHALMFPSCPFVRGLETGNRPMTREEKQATLRHEIHQSSLKKEVRQIRLKFPEYETSKKRLTSFKNWTLSYLIKPTALAEAGFFYTNKDDQVTCFSCGLRLEAWNPGDDAWGEHATWSPKCDWVLEKKGHYFVKAVSKSQF